MTEMTKTPELSDAVLDELLKDYEKPEDLLGPDGIFKALKKRMIEKALGAELSGHLGYEKSDPAGHGSGNSRNGASKKTVTSEDGSVEIGVPHDRNGSFEPQLVKKGQANFCLYQSKKRPPMTIAKRNVHKRPAPPEWGSRRNRPAA